MDGAGRVKKPNRIYHFDFWVCLISIISMEPVEYAIVCTHNAGICKALVARINRKFSVL